MSYNYFGKKILILGLGLTGISCINFFLKKGIITKVIDESINPSYLNQIPKNIKYKLGILDPVWILEADLIVMSPGISSFKPILIKARTLGIEIISDIELFSREAKFPIISITGTNGKSTVATMISQITQKAGYNTGFGGNIGFPALNMLDEKYNLYVLELSSFQLENTFTLCSKIATVLNIHEDHMNRYPKGFKQYKKIKLSIYNKSEICIINSNIKIKKSIKKTHKWIVLGTKKNDYHIYYHKNNAFLCHKNKKIFNMYYTLLSGRHNYNNALISLAICDAMKIPRNYTIEILKNFSTLPHRFQKIYTNTSINWINDSKSTNVNSTKVALDSIDYSTGTIRLLLGGDRKSANFNILKKYFIRLKIKIYCFGQDRIYLFNINKKKSIYVETLQQAMILISKEVVPGDTVLLSPGCSSLDQFKSFEERGNVFIKLTKEINCSIYNKKISNNHIL